MPHNEKMWALPADRAGSIWGELARALQKPEQTAAPAAALSGQQSEDYPGYDLMGNVAVIDINGSITRKAVIAWWSGRPITQGQDAILAALNSAAADKRVRAVMLNLNSPGGVVAGTKELADRIAEVAAQKPMAAYANGLMASAAFWLGAATGRIYAPVTATIGSVGVIWMHADWSKYYEGWGVNISYVTAGKWKAAGNDAAPLSDEERAYFERQLATIHEIFKADVVRGLGVSAPAATWAEGQTMLAEEARALGLVTGIVRDLESAVTLLSREATMNKQEFAANHPELLAEIQAEARAEALKEMQSKADEAAKAAEQKVFAMFKAVGGSEVADMVEKLYASGVDAEQFKSMAKVLGLNNADAASASAEESARAAILAGIEKSAAEPLSTAGKIKNTKKSSLVADAERRAQAARSA